MKEFVGTAITLIVLAMGLFLYKNNDLSLTASPDPSATDSATFVPSSSATSDITSAELNAELNQIEQELAELDTLINFDDL